MKRAFLLAALCMVFVAGCNLTAGSNDNPGWVNRLIADFQSKPVGNPPQSIWRYDYRGEAVYYVPAQCCDQFSTLYNSQGTVICAPDGGITGRGDGNCSDFLSGRKNEKLIWQDPRKR